jgi:hypothetical protein
MGGMQDHAPSMNDQACTIGDVMPRSSSCQAAARIHSDVLVTVLPSAGVPGQGASAVSMRHDSGPGGAPGPMARVVPPCAPPMKARIANECVMAATLAQSQGPRWIA